MYTLWYGDILLKKLRLTYFKILLIFVKLLFLSIFWLFFFFWIFLLIFFIYKFINKNKDSFLPLFNYNGYLSYIYNKVFKTEIKLDKSLNNPNYLIYFSDEMEEDSLSESSEFFIDNPDYDYEEIIDDFDEIAINTSDMPLNRESVEILVNHEIFIENSILYEDVYDDDDDDDELYNSDI